MRTHQNYVSAYKHNCNVMRSHDATLRFCFLPSKLARFTQKWTIEHTIVLSRASFTRCTLQKTKLSSLKVQNKKQMLLFLQLISSFVNLKRFCTLYFFFFFLSSFFLSFFFLSFFLSFFLFLLFYLSFFFCSLFSSFLRSILSFFFFSSRLFFPFSFYSFILEFDKNITQDCQV